LANSIWSFVGHKGNPRWLWHAIDHGTGAVLAYVFGRRQDAVFIKLQALLEPFGLTHYYTDHWGAHTRHLDPEEHTAGKRHTQKIERTDARHCHWLVCESVCLWTSSVNVAISTFETLPAVAQKSPCEGN
jgi:IS1 family transposase